MNTSKYRLMDFVTGSWVVRIFSVLLLSVACNAQAQLIGEPSRILDKNTVLLIDIPNSEEFIKKAKSNFYDVVYRADVEKKHFLPLNLSLLNRTYTPIRKLQTSKHWLIEAFGTIRSSSTKEIASTIKSLKPIAELGDGDTFTLDQENEIVESFAGLFSGRAFFAVEPTKDRINYLFGFDYKSDRFDWFDELKLASSEQSGEDPEVIGQVGSIEIYLLKSDRIFFFEHESAIYGMSSESVDDCAEFAGRVLEDLPEEDSLRGSRLFKRVEKSLDGNKYNSDCFCYLQLGKLVRALNKDPGKNVQSLVWGDGFGFLMKWESRDNYLSYRIASPMVFPLEKELAGGFPKALATLDLTKPRTFLPAEFFSYCHPENSSAYPYILAELGGLKMDPYSWFMHSDRNQLEAVRKSGFDYTTGMLLAFDQLRSHEQENCSFLSIFHSANKKHRVSVCGALIEGSDVVDWSVDELGDAFEEELKSVKMKKVSVSERQQNPVGAGNSGQTTSETIVLDGRRSSLVRKDGFLILNLYGTRNWSDELPVQDITKKFVAEDWFEGKLVGIKPKFLVVERNFDSFTYDGALRPLGIAMTELVNKLQDGMRWWTAPHDQVGKKRFSFLTHAGQSIANEFRMEFDEIFFVRGLSTNNRLPFYHVQALGVETKNELNVVYRGLLRRAKE